MNAMLQHHGSKRIYPVPEGLRELCTDISREVLRHQPTDIYCFIAEYLDTLLHTRETARVAARIISDIMDETLSYEAAWKRRGIDFNELNQAAIVIQAAYRGYVIRKILHMSFFPSETFRIISNCGIDISTADRASLIIQAAFRGHQIRKYLQTHKVPEGAIADKDEVNFINKILIEENITWEAANSAASVIQREFRRELSERALMESPPGEPQQTVQRFPFRRVPETKDVVEASAGPVGLTHGETTQLAEEIVVGMVAKASGYELRESEEIAGNILDTLLTKASGKKSTDENGKASELITAGDHEEEVKSDADEPAEGPNSFQKDISGDHAKFEEEKYDKASATDTEGEEITEPEKDITDSELVTTTDAPPSSTEPESEKDAGDSDMTSRSEPEYSEG